jgi:ribose 5-phosphate isomerase B
MKIAIASDHAGFGLKQEVVQYVSRLGQDVLDLGAASTEPSDYPDFAAAVGEALIESTAERGILICGSGVGVCVAANKMPSIRAAICHDIYSAHQGVEHDDMNVLVMGSRINWLRTRLRHCHSLLGRQVSVVGGPLCSSSE